MARKPFFLKSKYPPQDWMKCDKCGEYLDTIGGDTFWNPNKRARIKNICQNCYDARKKANQEWWDTVAAERQEEAERGRDAF